MISNTEQQNTIEPSLMTRSMGKEMLGYTRSTLRNYWKDYQNELNQLIFKQQNRPTGSLQAATDELAACEQFQGFLRLLAAPQPESNEVAQKRFKMIKAVKLVTSAFQNEVSRGGLN